jgi:23S rRNA pseudouridine2605 synthase
MSEKLQKVLARLGYGSRREMERWIEDGLIEVNGTVATIGARVSERDTISVEGEAIHLSEQQQKTRVILYHKPIGEICSHRDDEGGGSVFDNLPRLDSGRWISVGRLDVNTSGLLLLTNDGDLANKLMHPSSQIEREYAVRVLGEASEATLKKLTAGVQLEDGMARFEHIVDRGGKGANHWYYVVVTEGRNRLVRRLWESQRHAVSRLKRVRYGKVILGSTPKQGEHKELSTGEITNLCDTLS